jgi:hypothetical protein
VDLPVAVERSPCPRGGRQQFRFSSAVGRSMVIL